MTADFHPELLPASSVYIAVTGHRRNRLNPASCARVEAEMAALFAGLDRQVSGPCTLVTGMADGADLAAVRACPKGWKIKGILARSVPEWRAMLAEVSAQDVATFEALIPSATLDVLPGSTPDYVEVGRRILQGANGLVAVWNGEPGLPGGTGSVVARAQEQWLPTAIITAP